MGRKPKDLTQIMLEDITTKYNKAVKEFAEEVLYEIETAYENVIDKFYADYTPDYYDRTYSTYLGSSGYEDTNNPYNLWNIGDSWFAGINVSSSNIPGHPYKAYKGWVFDRTFFKGIHGIARADLRKINKYRGKLYHKEVIKIKTPKAMVPPPKKLLDREFKYITKHQKLDEQFNKIVRKYL